MFVTNYVCDKLYECKRTQNTFKKTKPKENIFNKSYTSKKENHRFIFTYINKSRVPCS